MKLRVNKKYLKMAPAMFLRQAGYALISDRRSGQESFVRRLSREFYPRFHLYLLLEGDDHIFNLHLDQKRPIYKGAEHAHNAEYDGEVVRGEIGRLKALLAGMQR